MEYRGLDVCGYVVDAIQVNAAFPWEELDGAAVYIVESGVCSYGRAEEHRHSLHAAARCIT